MNIKDNQSKAKRNFTFMPTLDSYIFREFLIIFFCCLLAFSCLFLISDLINKLGDFLEAHASFATTAYFFILMQPPDIVFVLPIALLLACMYTMARFGINNEITAMRASGISILRCGVPIYIIGILVTVVNFCLNESIAPWCSDRALILRKTASEPNYLMIKTRMLMFRSPDNVRTWLVKSFTSKNSLEGVQLKKCDTHGNLILELYADKAVYDKKDGWKFYGIKIVKYKTIQLVSRYSTQTEGQKQEIIVPVANTILKLDSKSKEYPELLGHVVETPDDIWNSIKDIENLTLFDIIRILKHSKDLASSELSTYKTLLYSKLAFPWVCLLSVFLGVPLAASNARKGIMISIVVAIGVIIFYLVLSQVFDVLGRQGYLPSFIAGAGPTIALAVYVWINMIRHR